MRMHVCMIIILLCYWIALGGMWHPVCGSRYYLMVSLLLESEAVSGQLVGQLNSPGIESNKLLNPQVG